MTTSGAIKAGKAYVEIFAEDSKLNRALQGMERKFKMIGSKLMSVGAGVGVVGASITTAFLPSINAASDMEETMNKFNVVFGENSKAVKAWGDNYAKDVGRSKKQLADFMAGSQDLFVPMGFDSSAALGMSKIVSQLSIDLASFNNMADDAVLRDLHAALTGSGEVMKKYGVIVSEAAVKQEALNMGLDPKKLTETQKAQARLNIIVAGTTAAQGDAIRSAGSYANQMKRLEAVWEDTKVAIGSALLPIVTPLLTTVGDIVTRFGDWADQNSGLIAIIFKVGAAIAAIGGGLVALGGIITAGGIAFGLISTAIATIGTIAAAVFGALFSWTGLIVALIAGGVYAAFELVIKKSEGFQKISERWSDTFEAIKTAIMSGDIQAAWNVVTAALKVEWIAFTDWLKSMVDKVWKGIVDNLPESWAKALKSMAKMLDALIVKLESLRQHAITGIADGLLYAYGKVAGMSDADIEDMREQNRQIGNQNQDRIANDIAFQNQLTNALESFLKGPDEQPEGDSPELEAAKAALAAAQAAAKATGATSGGNGDKSNGDADDPAKKIQDALAALNATMKKGGPGESKISAVGTFSAFGVGGLFGNPLDSIATATASTAKNTKKIAQQGGLKYS